MENKVAFYRQVFERFLVDRLCLCNFFIVFSACASPEGALEVSLHIHLTWMCKFFKIPVLSLDVQVSHQELASCEEVCRSVGLKQHIG